MFGKLEATSKINTSGVGLGLSICKKVIEALDGYIYLEQEDDFENILLRGNNNNSNGTSIVFVLNCLA
jgi:K+-sensing histidine kinase KdpD